MTALMATVWAMSLCVQASNAQKMAQPTALTLDEVQLQAVELGTISQRVQVGNVQRTCSNV